MKSGFLGERRETQSCRAGKRFRGERKVSMQALSAGGARGRQGRRARGEVPVHRPARRGRDQKDGEVGSAGSGKVTTKTETTCE